MLEKLEGYLREIDIDELTKLWKGLSLGLEEEIATISKSERTVRIAS